MVLHRNNNPQSSGRFVRPFAPARLTRGFSLLELMAAIAIMMVITGATFSLLEYYQRSYGRTQLKADMYEDVRGVAALMAQEIGQAGVLNLPPAQPTLSSAVVVGAATPTVSSATSMFVGEQLLVDTATNEELVSLTAADPVANTISAVFTKPHVVGAPLSVLGVFPNGVVWGANGSTTTSLRLFGDLNADGSLVYVRYDCNTTTGLLTRSIVTIVPGDITALGARNPSPSQTLLTTLIGNPGANPTFCFQYTAKMPATALTLGAGNGVTTTFSGTLGPTPLTAGKQAVVASSVIGVDNGAGGITGTGISSGTINYVTGAVSVTFLTAPATGITVQAGQSNLVFVTNVAVSLSVQTTKPDPQTRQFLTMTKSFLNLAPRNVLIGLELANGSPAITNRLQPTPPNVLLY